MKKTPSLDILQHLLGWGNFQQAHAQLNYRLHPVDSFGAMICGYEHHHQISFRRAALQTLEAVAEDIRKSCQRHGVPLWPALIREEAV